MAPIIQTIEIDRRPEDVYAYLDDLARHGEWQDAILDVTVGTPGPTRVGTRATELRRVPGGKQKVTYEITEHDPPRVFAFRGVSGPVRPVGRGTIEPIGDGSRSRYSLEFELVGHGVGKVLAPLAMKQARKELQAIQQRFKERLEAGA
jgi:hypothetical protein